MMLHYAIIQLITKLKNSKLITDDKNYKKFKSHLDFIVEKARVLPQKWKLLIIQQLDKQELTPDSRGYAKFYKEERNAAKRIAEKATTHEIGEEDDKAFDDMMDSEDDVLPLAPKRAEVETTPSLRPPPPGDGGARKKRKTKRRKTKRRNKKFKKTYKRRRSTKNRRRR